MFFLRVLGRGMSSREEVNKLGTNNISKQSPAHTFRKSSNLQGSVECGIIRYLR